MVLFFIWSKSTIHQAGFRSDLGETVAHSPARKSITCAKLRWRRRRLIGKLICAKSKLPKPTELTAVAEFEVTAANRQQLPAFGTGTQKSAIQFFVLLPSPALRTLEYQSGESPTEIGFNGTDISAGPAARQDFDHSRNDHANPWASA